MQHAVQQTKGFLYDSAAPAVQHPTQQQGNTGATNLTPEGVQVLHPPTSGGSAFRWRVAYPNRAGMDVLFTRAATRAEVAELYAGASIEQFADVPMRTATLHETDELHALIAAILVNDTEANRAEALAVALSDVDAALMCYRAMAAIR